MLYIWIYRDYVLFPRSLNVCKFVANMQECQQISVNVTFTKIWQTLIEYL